MPDQRREAPTLAVLAAGLGSRFGGPKQLVPVGPGGECLLEYLAFDAARAGFTSIAVVVHPDSADDVRATLRWLERSVDLRYVLQHPRRETRSGGPPKPWGTGQALLLAAEGIAGPVGVANADDFYGHAALSLLFEGLSAPAPDLVNVTFRLDRTLSANGSVNRGICRVDADGWISEVTECTGIARDETGTITGTAHGAAVELDPGQPVSMNLWGLPAGFVPLMRESWDRFQNGLTDASERATREFFLPDAIGEQLRRRGLRCRCLSSQSSWYGMTYPRDREQVIAMLRRAHNDGHYPSDIRRAL